MLNQGHISQRIVSREWRDSHRDSPFTSAGLSHHIGLDCITLDQIRSDDRKRESRDYRRATDYCSAEKQQYISSHRAEGMIEEDMSEEKTWSGDWYVGGHHMYSHQLVRFDVQSSQHVWRRDSTVLALIYLSYLCWNHQQACIMPLKCNNRVLFWKTCNYWRVSSLSLRDKISALHVDI